MGRSAQTRRRPDTVSDDTDTRLAAIMAAMERILANPAGLCESAAFALVDAIQKIDCLRVALEDDAADEFAVTTAYNAGFSAGQRSAAQQQPARRSAEDAAPVLRLLPPVPAERPRRVPAAVIVAAAAKAVAGTASTAAAIPLQD